ncbi:hypothetical protein [Chitinophaga barathri]|uniref:Uncharacterized protein n=1 Tax=Chitinophaga barathri TaxID=1647451 RepID=A0A3N4MHU8_9BACT|nr:hypothetical protein [Chitinophaga barathri]RPD43005.1 hypothetical protein EG028_01570 [Chitinophaga barathri]
MKKLKCLFLINLVFSTLWTKAQERPSNRLDITPYRVEIGKSAAVIISWKDNSHKKQHFYPRFIVMKRSENPKSGTVNAHRIVKGFRGVVTIPTWQLPGSEERTADFFKAAKPVIVKAVAAEIEADRVKWTFPYNPEYKLEASMSFKEGTNEPAIEYTFTPAESAWYTIGYAGMPETAAKDADAIWQPHVWQEKRFPQLSFLSPENMCSLPATMVEKDGLTVGVVAEPGDIPYELPSAGQGNLKFGVLVRNQSGKAQPMIFAPLFGTKASKLEGGKPFSFKFRVLMFKGNQPNSFRYVAQKMFGFKDYRENVYNNLNQTIENTIDFAMNDVYSGWNADLRGFDYSTDVAQTVKVVSGLHPLSVALITDNESIYRNRGLPIIEFLMSREKYLFALNKDVTRQNASSKMAGPSMEVAELAALQSFYQQGSPVFRYYADSLSRVSRSLNLNTTSRGDTWPNLLALYRMNGDKAVLEKAKKRADEYIKTRVDKKAEDFSGVEQAAQFWTDFAPWWIELLDLYEETKEPKYLEASIKGAKLYMQYIWFYPLIPNKDITINKGGIVENLSHEAERDGMAKMAAPEQLVPAWRVSQIGLTPEASNTYGSNPAIFLTHYAAHLLRLAYYSKDEFFRSVGRSAVVGRYSNYPGYDIDGIFNTVYARADYPLRAYNQISYNQVYYNHVWPQIALLFDYLVSDAFVLSKGNVSFPGQFSPGYAYLKSKVYGDKPGSFYGDQKVYLWMPKQVLTIDNEQLNYVTGYGNGKFYVAFLNQSDQAVSAKVHLNPDLIPFKHENNARVWEENAASPTVKVHDGTLRFSVAAKGITAFAIDDIHVATQFQQKAYSKTVQELSELSYNKTESPFGMISAAIYSLGTINTAHTWLNASGEQVSSATMHYRVAGSEKWLKAVDSSYPFEFTIPLHQNERELEFWVEAANSKGEVMKAKRTILK